MNSVRSAGAAIAPPQAARRPSRPTPERPAHGQAATRTPAGGSAPPAKAPLAGPGGLAGLWHRVTDFVAHVWNPDVVWTNPAARPDPKATSLRVASYNIMLGGQKLAEVEAALTAQRPDVVLVQEASDEAARYLAEKLGLHMTYMGSRFHPRGKAILSRFPIERAEELAVPGQGWRQRLSTFIDQ